MTATANPCSPRRASDSLDRIDLAAQRVAIDWSADHAAETEARSSLLGLFQQHIRESVEDSLNRHLLRRCGFLPHQTPELVKRLIEDLEDCYLAAFPNPNVHLDLERIAAGQSLSGWSRTTAMGFAQYMRLDRERYVDQAVPYDTSSGFDQDDMSGACGGGALWSRSALVESTVFGPSDETIRTMLADLEELASGAQENQAVRLTGEGYCRTHDLPALPRVVIPSTRRSTLLTAVRADLSRAWALWLGIRDGIEDERLVAAFHEWSVDDFEAVMDRGRRHVAAMLVAALTPAHPAPSRVRTSVVERLLAESRGASRGWQTTVQRLVEAAVVALSDVHRRGRTGKYVPLTMEQVEAAYREFTACLRDAVEFESSPLGSDVEQLRQLVSGRLRDAQMPPDHT